MRRRWRWFDRAMHRLEERLPEWIAKRLRISDYDHDEDELLPKKPAPPAKGSRRGASARAERVSLGEEPR
jgi:hypothetical protein